MKLLRKSFREWLARQRGNRKFWYADNSHCLIATWLKETKTCQDPHVSPTDVIDRAVDCVSKDFPPWLQYVNDLIVSIVDARAQGRDLHVHTVKEFRDLYNA